MLILTSSWSAGVSSVFGRIVAGLFLQGQTKKISEKFEDEDIEKVFDKLEFQLTEVN